MLSSHPKTWEETGEEAFSMSNAQTSPEKKGGEPVDLIASISVQPNQLRYSGELRFSWCKGGTIGDMARIRVTEIKEGKWVVFLPGGSMRQLTTKEIIATFPYIDSGAEFYHTKEL